MVLSYVVWTLGGLFLFGLVLYIVGVFNQLIRLKRNISKNFANLDVLLKQRHDEITNLINACKGYIEHERNLFEKIAELRTGYAQARVDDEKVLLANQLNRGLKSLFALAEAYPELKAAEQFAHIQGRITDLENDIADRRELFNESTTQHNIFIEQFPTSILASMFGCKQKPLLEFDEDIANSALPFTGENS